MTFDISTLDLVDQLKLLGTCVSQMHEMVIITDNPQNNHQKPKILYVNSAFTQVTGYSKEEALGKSPCMLQGPDTDSDTLILVSKAIHDDKNLHCELLNYKKNGEEYWIHLHLMAVFLDDKSCPYYIGISYNISEQKKTLELRIEQEETLKFILKTAGLGYWDLDIEKNQTTRSLKHDQCFGYTELQKDWSYQTFLSHVYKDDQVKVDAVFKQAISKGGDYDIEFRCQWPDKSMHWLWSKGRFINNDKNEVVRAAGIKVDITEKKLAEEKIQKLAFTDQLTQLPNRAVFNERLQAAIAVSARKNIFGALLFLDLDDFKFINDSLGHDVGDHLLVAIAERLRHNLRNIDTIARFGGDEFVIILDDLGPEILKVHEKLKQIHKKIISIFDLPFYCDNNEIHSRASIGTTLFNGNLASEHELLKQADLAMYFAKESGKNTVRFFNDEMQIDLFNRTNVERDLRQAIKNDEFYLVYQPKVDHQNKCIGLEALIRWRHPDRGILLPLDFISVAEDTGLIIPIGQWVLEQACLFLNSWSELKVPKRCSLSVNISPVQFDNKQFVARVTKALAFVPETTGRLMLEITENTLIKNFADSVLKLNLLTEQGVSFSLDDFGTGYSSLYYLKTLPIKEIKIDQSFVKDIIEDDVNEAIVSAVILIAEKLTLQVTVEGIETEEQLVLLKSLGANVFQGFYFSQPLSKTDAIAYMLKH